MPPDERRAAILAAAVPLLRERGAQVSTRDLAEAAGVAEGTLFRVFPDKRALLRAAIGAAMDPEPLIADLARVDLALPLEARIRCVIEIVSTRMDGVMQMVTALHDLARERPDDPDGRQPHHDGPDPRRDTRSLEAVAALLEPARDVLRVSPLQAAGLIRAAILGAHMPGLPDGARLQPADLAACLVRGLATGARPRVDDPPAVPGAHASLLTFSLVTASEPRC